MRNRIRKHKLGIRKPWRKKSREDSLSGADVTPKEEIAPNTPRSNGVDATDAASEGSEQDIDALFKSYEGDKKKNSEKEYHGMYIVILISN